MPEARPNAPPTDELGGQLEASVALAIAETAVETQ